MPVLSSNLKASLGPIPAPFSGATTWAALTPVINTINNNFNVIANGAGFIPGTVRLINGRPVNLSFGDLPILLSDVPDAASNVYVKSNFATVSSLTSLASSVNANIAIANTAIQSLRNTINTLPAGNAAGNTVQVSGWIQSNVTVINSAWTANAGSQQTQITNLSTDVANYKTYANTQIGSLYARMDSITAAAGQTGTNIAALSANAVTQATQITAIAGNLTNHQSVVANTLNTVTNNINAAQSQIDNLGTQQSYTNDQLVSVSTQIDTLTTRVSATNNNLTSNVGAIKANVSTLFANAAVQAQAIAAINSNVAVIANNNNRTIHISTQAPGPGDGAVGDIWYQTY